MKSSRGPVILQSAMLLLVFAGLGYWAWKRYHPPAAPTYEGKTLDQWINDLDDPDYQVGRRAADVLVNVGEPTVSILLQAREQGDIRLHRRAVGVLVRIGAPAAPGLVEALAGKPRLQRIEVALVRMGAAAVPALRAGLHDEKISKEATHVLGLMGPRAAEAAPDLLALLKNRQTPAPLRQEAAFALGQIGEPVAQIVPALIAALAESKMEVRLQAAETLAWIGPPAREAVPALIAALKDDEAKVAKMACHALVSLEATAAVPALLEAIQTKGGPLVAEASWALWRLGAKEPTVLPALLPLAKGPIANTVAARDLLASFGPQVVPLLRKTLHEDDAALREVAVEVLGRIGPPAHEAVPDLLAALKDKTPAVALTAAMALTEIDSTRAGDAVPLLADSLDTPGAAQALANIGPNARAAVPALITALKPRKEAANQDLLRAGARLALARIGTAAVPNLLEALKDKREGVAPLAGEALGWILPPPKQAVPALRQALRDDRAHADVYARALGQLGSVAREAVPDLTALLPEAALRPEAAVALVRMEPKQAATVVPLLVKDLQAADETQRQQAAAALGLMGPPAKAAAPELVKALRRRELLQPALLALKALGRDAVPSLSALLKDENVEYRRLAVFLLGEIGPAAKEALPDLITVLGHSDSVLSAGAARVLEAIGPAAGPAVPALIANLQSYQTDVRRAASLALGHIESAAREAREPLLECLLDPDDDVRYAAALSLGRIDPQFREAAPALRDALNDPYPPARLAAIDSLSKIDRASVEETVPVLLVLSREPQEPVVRFRAMEGVARLAPERARPFMPFLTMELYDLDPAPRLNASLLLVLLDSEQIVRVALSLAGALRTPLPAARTLIVQKLAMLGPKARDAVPAIARLLQDGTPGIREEAIKALRAIDPRSAKRFGVDQEKN